MSLSPAAAANVCTGGVQCGVRLLRHRCGRHDEGIPLCFLPLLISNNTEFALESMVTGEAAHDCDASAAEVRAERVNEPAMK